MSSVRRLALDAPSFPLTLDEVADVGGHPPEEQAHGQPREADGDGDPHDECDEYSDECREWHPGLVSPCVSLEQTACPDMSSLDSRSG